nr:MAG TPA: hypothetical protein [Caudoviricetes sp.]
MEQAMQLLNKAFDTLSTVLIAASQAGKVGSVQTNLQQVYAILQREVAEYEKDKRELAALKIQVKAAEKSDEESEVTDG